jgi:hypothetical protein
LRQAARAAATSGRSCSAAWAVFFSTHPLGQKKVAQRRALRLDPLGGQKGAKLVEGDVAVLLNQKPNAIGMGGQFWFLPSTVLIGLDRASLLPPLHQLHNEADAHIKPLRRRVPRRARVNNPNNPFT